LAVGDGVLRVIVTEMMSARTREDVNITNAKDANNLLKFIVQIPRKGDDRDTPDLLLNHRGPNVKQLHRIFWKGRTFLQKQQKSQASNRIA
jgi:hypothetical protein